MQMNEVGVGTDLSRPCEQSIPKPGRDKSVPTTNASLLICSSA